MKTVLFVIISVPVYGILYVFTALSVLAVILLSYLQLKTMVYRGIWFWANTSFLLMGKRLKVSGKSNILKGQKYVLIANHASLFDIVAIMAIHPSVSWFGHVRLTKIPVFKHLLKMIDYMPVKHGNLKNTKEVIEQAKQNANGLTIAVFPEGTRTKDGKIQPFFRGFVHVLKHANMQLLPVTLNGFYELKPKHRFSINFSAKLNITIHQPINPEKYEQKNDNEIIVHAKEVIESAYTG